MAKKKYVAELIATQTVYLSCYVEADSEEEAEDKLITGDYDIIGTVSGDLGNDFHLSELEELTDE